MRPPWWFPRPLYSECRAVDVTPALPLEEASLASLVETQMREFRDVQRADATAVAAA